MRRENYACVTNGVMIKLLKLYNVVLILLGRTNQSTTVTKG
jgi:hypothetical protein